MEKPILVTNIDGLLLEHEVFYEPHQEWFKRAIKKTGDNSLKKWIGTKLYFQGVNEAMEKIMPTASKEERTRKAREWYQKDVINYIKLHPEKIKKNIAKKLLSLKNKYKLILVTTNTLDYINQIIEAAKLIGIYEDIIASKTEEEPNKESLIKILIKKYGKPKYYLAGKPEKDINGLFEKLGTGILDINQINKL